MPANSIRERLHTVRAPERLLIEGPGFVWNRASCPVSTAAHIQSKNFAETLVLLDPSAAAEEVVGNTKFVLDCQSNCQYPILKQ